MTHLSIEHALLAVMAAGVGDTTTAADHISRAQQQSRITARRARQVVEIAALVVAGDRARAAGLALEHATEFADDADLLVSLTRLPSGTTSTTEDHGMCHEVASSWPLKVPRSARASTSPQP